MQQGEITVFQTVLETTMVLYSVSSSSKDFQLQGANQATRKYKIRNDTVELIKYVRRKIIKTRQLISVHKEYSIYFVNHQTKQVTPTQAPVSTILC